MCSFFHKYILPCRYIESALYRDRVITTMLLQCNVGSSIVATNTVADDYWLPLVWLVIIDLRVQNLHTLCTHIRQLPKTELLSSFISWHIFAILRKNSSFTPPPTPPPTPVADDERNDLSDLAPCQSPRCMSAPTNIGGRASRFLRGLVVKALDCDAEPPCRCGFESQTVHCINLLRNHLFVPHRRQNINDNKKNSNTCIFCACKTTPWPGHIIRSWMSLQSQFSPQ